MQQIAKNLAIWCSAASPNTLGIYNNLFFLPNPFLGRFFILDEPFWQSGVIQTRLDLRRRNTPLNVVVKTIEPDQPPGIFSSSCSEKTFKKNCFPLIDYNYFLYRMFDVFWQLIQQDITIVWQSLN